VGYINAHGTGTQANDAVRRRRSGRCFGVARIEDPVSSTKSMHGHLLGRGGRAGAGRGGDGDASRDPAAHHATCAEPDPECDLDYVPLGRAAVQRPAR
jgi:3-oxoacyl-(acyl-carrier-protein) synthase